MTPTERHILEFLRHLGYCVMGSPGVVCSKDFHALLDKTSEMLAESAPSKKARR